MTPITIIPKNSDIGDAKLCFFPILFVKTYSLSTEELNKFLKKPSALYPLTTFKPDNVSSTIEIK